MKTVAFFLLLTTAIACGKSDHKGQSVEFITSGQIQDSIFKNLEMVVGNALSGDMLNDSLAFLILPIQASCPSCRKKTIDSLMNHRSRIAMDHFVIISANAGQKTINGYFLEQDYTLPEIPGHLFVDSGNLARKYELCIDKPTIYYTHNKKAFKKVTAVPATVKEDLKEFFSGYREK